MFYFKPESEVEAATRTPIPWDNWGPKGTRFVPANNIGLNPGALKRFVPRLNNIFLIDSKPIYHSRRATFGNRAMIYDELKDKLYDFNPNPKRGGVPLGPSVIKIADGPFNRDIQTHHPCRESELPGSQWKSLGVMMGEESLIFLKVGRPPFKESSRWLLIIV